MKLKSILISLIGVMIVACSSTGPMKIILDQSSEDKPDWVKSSKISWQEKKELYFKATYTIRSHERVNGCIDLAKLDAKEDLISAIDNEIKGAIDNAQESINVNSEIIMGKVRSSNFQGSIRGLHFIESFWERYQMGNDEEAITCHVLSRVNEKDYIKMKRAIINKVVSIEPRIREAITKKQINFFDEQRRDPSESK